MAEIGSLVIWEKLFTNSSEVAADPDTVRFFLREEIDGTELEWTFTGGVATVTPTGMNPIVKDSTGNYHVNWIARKPERLTGTWLGTGTIFQTSTITAFVRHSLIATVGP